MRKEVKAGVPRFIKWAGGKQQLLEQFQPLFPKKFNRYFEPFLGSGAVALHLMQQYPERTFILSDINKDLINAYNVIKSNLSELKVILKKHKEEYHKAAKEYYYKVRDELDPNTLSNIEKAARFIFLNKTCWNGLYRVNLKGKFNVPMGDYKNRDIVQEDKLNAITELIKNTAVEVRTFEEVLKHAKKGDFVYFDPPYYPLENKKSFTTYTKGKFLEKEQEKLAEVFRKLDKKGCKVMLSNSDTKFIKDLYKDYEIKTVKATRRINSKASGRGKINEVVVVNYPLS